MILELFALLFAISLVLVFIGRYLESPPVKMSSYLFIFILSLILLTGNVMYKTGQTSTVETNSGTTYINNTNTYSNFDTEIVYGLTVNHVIGFYMCILAAFGFITEIMNLKTEEVFK